MEVSIVILAGGESQRMGTDKAFVDVGGNTFLSHQLAFAKSISSDVWVSCSPKNRKEINAIHDQVFVDLVSKQGPLQGMAQGLQNAKFEWVWFLPIDMPKIDEELLRVLCANSIGEKAVVYQKDQHIYSVCGLYHKSCKKIFDVALQQNKLALKRVIPDLKPMLVRTGVKVDKLKNINTPNELLEL